MGVELGTLEKMALRNAWDREDTGFTPWLAQETNLNALAEALGIDELVLIQREYPIGDFKLDILCSNGDEKVIIENQLERTNHDHLGKILTYAAGVGAKKIIWIAESFRPEHVAALEFLNDNTTDGLSFFAAQIELWRIGDSPMAPKFGVVVKPDDWTRVEREQAQTTSAASPTKQLQLRFWKALRSYLAENHCKVRLSKPQPQHWLNSGIGRTGISLNVTANTRDRRLTAEIYLSSDNAKEQFKTLLAKKTEIEEALGFALDWQPLPDKIGSRIQTILDDISVSEEDRWPEYFQWFDERLTKLNKVFRPLVKALP